MKTKMTQTRPYGWLLIAGVFAAAFIRWASAAEFTGPQPVHPNYKQAKTEYSMMAWFDSDAREWLRVQGDASATTLSTQWGPHSVTIETTREPQVAKTLTGWIIVFK